MDSQPAKKNCRVFLVANREELSLSWSISALVHGAVSSIAVSVKRRFSETPHKECLQTSIFFFLRKTLGVYASYRHGSHTSAIISALVFNPRGLMVHTRRPHVRNTKHAERNFPLSGEGAAHLAYSGIGKFGNTGGRWITLLPPFNHPYTLLPIRTASGTNGGEDESDNGEGTNAILKSWPMPCMPLHLEQKPRLEGYSRRHVLEELPIHPKHTKLGANTSDEKQRLRFITT